MAGMTDEEKTPAEAALVVRPFQNADAEAVAALVTASVRGHWTYRPEHFRVTEDPRKQRLVAVRGGKVVATASLTPFGGGAPDALRLDLAGDGAAFSPLYLHLLSRLPQGFRRVLGVCREDFSEKMEFFGAAGFRNAWQSWGAHLDLTAFDPERFRALEEKLFMQGYEVERLTSLDADWGEFYALHQQGEAGVPRNPTTTSLPLESTELRRLIEAEEAAFVVRCGGKIVALTRLTLGERKPGGLVQLHEVENELTATHSAHRSRGLATLLKAHALAWAGAQGYTQASTGGTVLNLPMLRVNTRLGYAVERMWVTWEYVLG